MAINKSTGNLKEDLVNAINKNASGKSNINEYADDLSNAIKNFVIRQEFRVVKLESDIDVEHIRTTDNLSVDVKPDTLLGPYSPLISLLKKLAGSIPGLEYVFDSLEQRIRSAVNRVSGDGATLPKLDLKDGGTGGELDVRGISSVDTVYKGRKSAEGISTKSTVVLFEDEIIDDVKK